MVIDSKKAYKSLRSKGFTDAPGDHKFLEFIHEGKLIARTKISHGSTHDLGDLLIGKMSSQCKITKQEFSNLVNCTLSQDGYVQKLRNAQEID